MLLSFCLIFWQFQPGVAYESVAYKKKACIYILHLHPAILLKDVQKYFSTTFTNVLATCFIEHLSVDSLRSHKDLYIKCLVPVRPILKKISTRLFTFLQLLQFFNVCNFMNINLYRILITHT